MADSPISNRRQKSHPSSTRTPGSWPRTIRSCCCSKAMAPGPTAGGRARGSSVRLFRRFAAVRLASSGHRYWPVRRRETRWVSGCPPMRWRRSGFEGLRGAVRELLRTPADGAIPESAHHALGNAGSLIHAGVTMCRLGWRAAGDLIERGLRGGLSRKRATHDLARRMQGATELKTVGVRWRGQCRDVTLLSVLIGAFILGVWS
jgi:hypothetical protein